LTGATTSPPGRNQDCSRPKSAPPSGLCASRLSSGRRRIPFPAGPDGCIPGHRVRRETPHCPAGLHTSPARLPVEGRLPSFDGATGWLKVTLVIFWTYTCINWFRRLPYLRAWAGKYADHSLAVIGVHTPEFGFEDELANVRRAVHDMRIDYPVALDND
jgi:hypothetical protein